MADKPTVVPGTEGDIPSISIGNPRLSPSAALSVGTPADVAAGPGAEEINAARPKPVSSQTIDPGTAPAAPSAAEQALQQQRAGERQPQAPPVGQEVAVGTPEQNVAGVDVEEANRLQRAANPQAITEPARPNAQSPSEAVRDAEGRSGGRNLDINKAGLEGMHTTLQRISDLASGKEKGLTKQPVIDAALEALNLPSEVMGETLSETLKQAGIDPDTAARVGLAAGIVGSLAYGAKMPVGMGAPGKVAQLLGFGEKTRLAAKGALELDAGFVRSAGDITEVLASPKARQERLASLVEQGLQANGGATVNVMRGAVPIRPQDAAVSVVPSRSKVIDGDATKADILAFTKKNADLLDSYPDLHVGAWKDAETGKTHLDLSVVTTPELAQELGKANRQKAIYLGSGESVPVQHTFSIERGTTGHGYTPVENLRPEDVAMAKQYDAAPVLDEEAVPAWRDLMAHVKQDVEQNIAPRLQITEVSGQPYASAQEMNADIAAGRLKVSVDNSEHPVWTPQENVLFRIWHDYHQHFENGADFSLEGEWRAMKTAVESIPSRTARQAAEVEIYGQAAAAVANKGEFQIQKIYLPGKKYAAKGAEDIHAQLQGLQRVQQTVPHSPIADALEADAAEVLADTPRGIEVFHGTGQVFDKANFASDEFRGGGLWVAERPQTASRYAEMQRGDAPNVRPYYLDPTAKLASVEQFDELNAQGIGYQGVMQELMAQGYDGVAFKGAHADMTGKGTNYWVFNPGVLTEKFTGQRAAMLAMLGLGAAGGAMATQDEQGAPAGAMAGVAVLTRGKGAKVLSRAEQLAKSTGGNLRYLTKAIDWASARPNSKEVGALASVGAAMLARDEVKKPADMMAMLAARYGEGVLAHSATITEKAQEKYERFIKALDMRPTEEVLSFFRKGDTLPDWYSSGERVRAVFGKDADLVAGLIAATSAHNSNANSVEAALHIYAAAKTGKVDVQAGELRAWLENEIKTNPDFRAWSMDTHFNNVERAFLGQELSGNKVRNYKAAILGDENAVVIDTHIEQALKPRKRKPGEVDAQGLPDWVTEDSTVSPEVAKAIDEGKSPNDNDAVYAFYEDRVRRLAAEQGVTPRYMQQAIWTGKLLLDPGKGRIDSLAPLADMFRDVAKQRGYDHLFPGLSESDTKGLAVLGLASSLLAAGADAAANGGVTPDHVEAAMPGIAGNVRLRRAIIAAVREMRNLPGMAREIKPATAEQALDVLTAPKAEIKAGDKLLGLDWVGMSKDADHLPNTIKTVREAFEDAIKADSRGVVSHQMERDMARTLTDLGYDAEVAIAKWKEGDRSVVSTEIMAVAALAKESVLETDRLASLALKLEGTPEGAQALQEFTRQLGVSGSLLQVLDGQAEEAGRALGVFRSMVGDVNPAKKALAVGEAEKAQRGLSVAMQGATSAPAGAPAGARAARGGAFQGPPSPQAVVAAGNQMIQQAQAAQLQAMQGLLTAWNALPKSQQRGIFLKELGRWGLDLIKEVWYNSLLWTFPGQLANLAGNVQAQVGETMSRVLGSGIGFVRHDVLGVGPAGSTLGEITDGQFAGMLDSISEAFVAAGRSWWTGNPESAAIMGSSVARTPRAITGERIADVAALAGYQIPNAVYHGVNVIGATLGAGTRAMLAGDEWMKVVAFRGELHRLAYESAQKAGLVGQPFSTHVAAFLSSPPPEAMKAAKEYAHYVTYTSPLDGTLAMISRVGKSTMMLPFTPFFDTLVNVMKYELEWMPGLNMLVKKSRQDLMTPGPRQDQALAKLAVGSTMLATALGLYFRGNLSGRGPSDKNIKRDMVDIQKYQPNSFVFRGEDGLKHYYGINRFDPANFPFLFAANYGDIALEALNGRGVSQETLAELALAGAVTLGEMATTRNYFQGYQRAIEIATAKDLATFNKFQKFGQQVAGQVVPSGLAQVNRNMDPYMRATYSALDAVYARLPWMSDKLYPDVNLKGEPRFKTAALGPDWMSPIPYSKEEPDVVGKELLNNGVSIDKPPVSLFGPPPPALIGEENSAHGIRLDGKQYLRFSQLAGNQLKLPAGDIMEAVRALGYEGPEPQGKLGMWDFLTTLVQTKTWKDGKFEGYDLMEGPGGAKNKILRSVIQAYRTAAAGQLLREDSKLRDKYLAKVADRAETFGGPRARAQAEEAIKTADIDTILKMTGIE